jgi:metal-dependent amidase/aminoacylase/carboxypeptidase family protein
MAILCGLAIEFGQKPKTGRVILLFQPAEEDGSGAQKSVFRHKICCI